MVTTAANWARSFVVDGVAASGDHEPDKADIRAWGAWVEAGLNAGTLNGPWMASLSALNADLAHAANTVGFVYTTANIGTYVKSGASGAGSWSKILDYVPGLQFSRASDNGSTANAWVLTTSPQASASDGVTIIFGFVPATNTSSTVTAALDGGSVLSVKAGSNSNPTIGGLVSGMPFMALVSGTGTTLRLLSDQAAAAGFDHQGDWSAVVTYTENQIVTGSDGKWYQLKVASALNDNPVSGGSGDWIEIIGGVGGVADNSISTVKLQDGAVTEPKLDDAVIAAKIDAAAGKSALVYADKFGIVDSEDSNALKAPSIQNLLSYLRTEFGIGENVGFHGAKGDLQMVSDAAITATDNTLTSATASFVAGDVGKVVLVAGAGAAGAKLATTIASVTDANTVELTAAAVTTVSGAYFSWGTDDTAACTASLAALNGRGGDIVFGPKTYLINAGNTAFDIDAPCHPRGFGWTNSLGITTDRVTKIVKSGARVGYGIGVKSDAVTLEGFWFMGETGNTGTGILVGNTADAPFFTARMLTVFRMGGWGMILDDGAAYNVNYARLDDLYLSSNGVASATGGLQLTGDATPDVNAAFMARVIARENTGVGIDFHAATGWSGQAVSASSNTSYGITINTGAAFNKLWTGNIEGNNGGAGNHQIYLASGTQDNYVVALGQNPATEISNNDASNVVATAAADM